MIAKNPGRKGKMVETQLLPQLASLANSCRTRERFPRGAGRAGALRVCDLGVRSSCEALPRQPVLPCPGQLTDARRMLTSAVGGAPKRKGHIREGGNETPAQWSMRLFIDCAVIGSHCVPGPGREGGMKCKQQHNPEQLPPGAPAPGHRADECFLCAVSSNGHSNPSGKALT